MSVEKLNFFHAMGIEKPDSMLFFEHGLRTFAVESPSTNNPISEKFMVTLGDRHSFDSLITLQIVHEIRATEQVMLLYNRAKKHLIDNVVKFRDYNIDENFTLVEKMKNSQ